MPSVGHIAPKSSKAVKVVFRAESSVKYEDLEVMCESSAVTQAGSSFIDWDDSQTEIRLVRPSEYKKIMRQRELEEQRRREEAEAAAAAAAAGGKKGAPAKAPPPKKKEEEKVEEEEEIDMSEEPSVELKEVKPEPEHEVVEGSTKSVSLKTFATGK